MDISSILEIAGIVIGGGGVIGFIVGIATIRYERMKARGEARTAENEATKSVQDVYQEMITDVREDREEQKRYIQELREDRRHLREERNELRRRQEETDEKMRSQDKIIARLGRRVDSLTPLICTIVGCKQRERNMIDMVNDDSFDPKRDTNIGELHTEEK